MAKQKSPETNESRQNLSANAHDQQLYAISQYLSKVKFAPRMMGVDEADVWRKLEKLCELYEDVLTAERMHAAQLEREYKALQQKHQGLIAKSQNLLEAYRKLAGEGREDG